MNRFRRPLLAAGLLIGLLAGGTAATASPVVVTFEGVQPGNGTAGQYNWNTGGTTHPGLLYTPFGNGSASATHFVSFCIERTQRITVGATYSSYTFTTLTSSPNPGPPMSAATAESIRAMWAEYRDDLDVGTAAEREAKSAAFQQAVWSMLEPDYEASLPANETTYFTQFTNASNWRSGLANLMVLGSGSQQDQLVEFTSLAPEHTPEPGMLALALLVAPAVYLRRRLAAKPA